MHSRELFLSLGNMLNMRLEAMEKRLPPEPVLRPPPAADRARAPSSHQDDSASRIEPAQSVQTVPTAARAKAQPKAKVQPRPPGRR